ncbi:glycylpeptide N-tetradecanoyltransferase 1-like isoform X2 [Pomacea canaliculata]|uniref:glycylpeptide N-tetradecanoyltransferase 1-like isoform X2 n=1 Tax=Pomacea canaliculata TaxID=400727 RepID=UPI000D72FC04|nr:glycylpeptide N-tetradecanoyltransferase 1-like isoform X2 [Pomacea canaliculata]
MPILEPLTPMQKAKSKLRTSKLQMTDCCVYQDATARKKSKKKRRKPRDLERSSGDSDTQLASDEVDRRNLCSMLGTSARRGSKEVSSDRSQSGMEADSESQGSYDSKKLTLERGLDVGDMEDDKNDNQAQSGSAFSNLAQIQKAVELLSLQPSAPKSLEEAKKKKFHFWETQPVPRFDEVIQCNAEIEPDKPVGEIRSEPLSLPSGFTWDTLDIGDPLILKELYTLLNENYVEDDDNMFRFDYSPEFLQWALQPPGWLRTWHCGVRVIKSKKLVGFISAVPANIKIYNRTKKMVEINFLCVHKKLRSKRVAPVLIKEITRRVHQQGLFQAVYTAGVVLPKPVASCRYWHRSLNPRKLIEVKFSHLSRNMTMQRTLKLYKLPDTPRTPGFRRFTPADVADAYKLLAQYMQKFDLAPVFSKEEFRHWFIPRENIVDSYVVERDGEITDFVSFYTLPSTVMHHPTHKLLKAAYSFYNVSGATPWVDLMQDALIVAKNMGFDVFNALDLMDNKEFLEKLKFGVGDGFLQYYLYNWRCPSMDTHKVGLVLQ